MSRPTQPPLRAPRGHGAGRPGLASSDEVPRLTPRRPGVIALTAALAVVLIAVAATVGIRVATASADRIPPGVSIAGVPVGGMTADQAERAVASLAGPATGDIVLEYDGDADGFPLRIGRSDLAPIPRAKVAVAEAMEQPSVWDRILREVGAGRDRDIPLSYRVAGGPLNELLGRVDALLERPARNAAVRVASGDLTLVAAKDGRRVDRARLKSALSSLPDRVEVTTDAVPPAVADAAAKSARVRARRIVQGPVRVTGSGRATTIPTSTMLGALRFERAGDAIRVSLDSATIAGALQDTFGPLERDATSASFRVDGNAVRVIAGRNGRTINAAAVARALQRGTGARSVRVRMTPVEPERTTTDARAMRITTQIAEFRTPYDCCQPRVTNIKRGAAILDGTIIPAGGTFSLNDALGQRTTARGFVAAPQINEGRLEDAVGGGVSQIATTMFNAAFFGGLRLVSHTPHSFWITRYPPGREATVSWGGPELIVENDWPAAVLIKASADDSGITIRLYSSKLGRRVTTTGAEDGSSGQAFTATYTRKVYAGATLKRDETYTWRYSAPPAGE